MDLQVGPDLEIILKLHIEYLQNIPVHSVSILGG